jgi:hypothetical protein
MKNDGSLIRLKARLGDLVDDASGFAERLVGWAKTNPQAKILAQAIGWRGQEAAFHIIYSIRSILTLLANTNATSEQAIQVLKDVGLGSAQLLLRFISKIWSSPP